MSVENFLYIKEIADDGLRMSGRTAFQGRNIKIKTSVILPSDGSAYVEIGGTKVLAGVKVMEGVPFPDRPKEGGLIVNFEASELASKYADDRITYSIEVGRVTDRGIRESNLIDLTKLVLEEGKKALFVYVDIAAMNNEGNLFDAANIAALAALLNARYKRPDSDERFPLPLDNSKLSVSHTFAKVGKSLFFDPDAEEENAADARFTIAISDKINSIQKGGSGFFTAEEIDTCVGKAFEARENTIKVLMDSTGK